MGGIFRARLTLVAVLLFSFMFLFCAELFAQEVNENSLSLKYIDSLIAQTNYDEAITLLSRFIEQNPEKFDAAQKRIDKIMKARSSYSMLANELLDTIEKEPENAEKHLQIISKLESLEKNPTEEHLAFIRQAKRAAQFVYYNSQYTKIMAQAEKETQKQNYVRAIHGIQEGFYMYQKEFYETQSAAVTDSVTTRVNSINEYVSKYENLQNNLTTTFNALYTALKNNDYNASEIAFMPFSREMKNFSDVRNSLMSTAHSLEETFLSLEREDPVLTDASYLPFIYHFVYGRASSADSGIIGALDAQWNRFIETLKTLVNEIELNKIELYCASCPQNDFMQTTFTPENMRLAELKEFSLLGIKINSLYSLLQNKDGTSIGDPCPLWTLSMNFASDIANGTEMSVQNLEAYKTALNTKDNFLSLEKKVEAIRETFDYPKRLLANIGKLEECRKVADENLNATWFTSFVQGYENQIESMHKTEIINEDMEKEIVKDTRPDAGIARLNSYLDFSKQTDLYKKINSILSQSSYEVVSGIWEQVATYYASSASEMEKGYSGLYEVARTMFEGITDDTPKELNPSSLPPGRYPSESLERIQGIQSSISNDKTILNFTLESLSEGEQYKNAYENQEKEIKRIIGVMDSFLREGNDIAQKVREENVLAKSALNEADLRYSQSVAALNNKNFDTARERLQQAREKYNESLYHQESKTLRETSDKKLAALGVQINDAENKIIVAEVRALKTQAKNEYYAGNFESAENLLTRAKTRWAVTNVEEDQEITDILVLVETALNMKTGRVLSPTAPLYPEMSQVLSIAHQFFDEGSSIIKKDRAKGVDILKKAKEKLQELQTVYPLNQDASLLSLRIDQLIDPDSFNEIFSHRLTAARENVKIPSRQQVGYSDLLDLYEIRPSYPGLKQILYDVEIEIGIRQKPVDQSGKLRSIALTREAENLVNVANGNEAVLKQALTKLDQAIQLDSSNDRAMLLKDRIQVSIGGKSAVVLSSADEARYQKAISLLQKNDILGAYSIVEQLLQNANNQRSAKILDLQRKVKAQM